MMENRWKIQENPIRKSMPFLGNLHESCVCCSWS
jgi:hypothetical protein